MTFQTVEQMQDKINILEGAVSALEDAINAQAMSIKMLEVAAAQDERAKIVAWARSMLLDLAAQEIEAGEHLK
jgi:hypothetical protein